MRTPRKLKGNTSPDGKTKVFTVRLKWEYSEMLEILAGMTGHSVAKELNGLLGLGFRSYDTAEPTTALRMKAEFLKRELERVKRAASDSEMNDHAVKQEDDLALRRRLQSDIDQSRHLIAQAIEAKKLRDQLAKLPGRSRTITDGED